METKGCAVQHAVRGLDVVDGLPPVPSSIKDQMPDLAAFLQSLAANIGRELVQRQLKASVDLRTAFRLDDYAAVREVYRRGHGWVYWEENGYCVGVPAERMAQFARRHRGGW